MANGLLGERKQTATGGAWQTYWINFNTFASDERASFLVSSWGCRHSGNAEKSVSRFFVVVFSTATFLRVNLSQGELLSVKSSHKIEFYHQPEVCAGTASFRQSGSIIADK